MVATKGSSVVFEAALGLALMLCATPRFCHAQVATNAQPTSRPPPPQPVAVVSDTEARARLAFEAGLSFANEERWGEALRAFQQSANLVLRANSAFNIATTLVRLGRHVDAVIAFQRYLSIADRTVDAARIEVAQTQLGLEQAQLAHVRLTLTPANATLRVDGRILPEPGERRDVALDPGVHDIEVSADGHEIYRSQENPAAGTSLERSVRLSRITWGLLEIQTSVASAAVTLDGNLFSTVNGALRVSVGSHRVRAAAQGHEGVERVIQVFAGQHLRMDLVLQRDQRTLLSRPWFWGIIGGTALAITGIITVVALSVEPPPFESTTGIVVQGIRSE